MATALLRITHLVLIRPKWTLFGLKSRSRSGPPPGCQSGETTQHGLRWLDSSYLFQCSNIASVVDPSGCHCYPGSSVWCFSSIESSEGYQDCQCLQRRNVEGWLLSLCVHPGHPVPKGKPQVREAGLILLAVSRTRSQPPMRVRSLLACASNLGELSASSWLTANGQCGLRLISQARCLKMKDTQDGTRRTDPLGWTNLYSGPRNALWNSSVPSTCIIRPRPSSKLLKVGECRTGHLSGRLAEISKWMRDVQQLVANQLSLLSAVLRHDKGALHVAHPDHPKPGRALALTSVCSRFSI